MDNIKIDASQIFSPLLIQILEIKAAVFTVLEIQKKEMSNEKQVLYNNLFLRNLRQEITVFAKQYPEIIPDWEKIKKKF